MKEKFLKIIKTVEFLFIGIAVLAGALLGVIESDYAIFIFIGYVAINIFGLATKNYRKSTNSRAKTGEGTDPDKEEK